MMKKKRRIVNANNNKEDETESSSDDEHVLGKEEYEAPERALNARRERRVQRCARSKGEERPAVSTSAGMRIVAARAGVYSVQRERTESEVRKQLVE